MSGMDRHGTNTGQDDGFNFTDIDFSLPDDEVAMLGSSPDESARAGAHSNSPAQVRVDAQPQPQPQPTSHMSETLGSQDDEPVVERKSSSKTNLIIIGVATLMVSMVSVVGYFGWNQFKSKAPASADAGFGNPQIGGESAAGGRGPNSTIETADGIADALGDLDAPGEKTAPLIVEEALGDPANDTLLGGESGVGQSQAPISPQGQSAGGMPAAQQEPAAASATDEEAIYDHLLNQADKLDVPSSAIKIDTSVVSQAVERKRLEKLEGDVKAARSDVDEMKQVVTSMQSQVAEISSVVKISQASNEKLFSAIDALAKDVEAANKKQESEVETLQKKIDAVGEKANKAVETAATQARAAAQAVIAKAPAPVQAPAPAPAPQPRPAAPAVQAAQRAPAPTPAPRPVEVARTAPVTLPPPSEVRSVTAPVTARSDMPAQCDGRYTSSNWRVKGINSTAAYVVRAQDGEGLMVRVGMTVPGFGEVLSFDRQSRTVCTTQGLVKR